MNSQKNFKTIERKFFITIISLSVLSVVTLGSLLYQANTVRFGGEVSSNELQDLVQDSSAVAEYLEDQKDYEAHFITIANLTKEDQQRALGQALIITTAIVLLFVGFMSFIIARYLLKPVEEAYASQERFMQDAAHELRNPLAAIDIALSTRTEDKDPELIDIIKRQNNRLVGIVEDLLFLERRRTGEEIPITNISTLMEDVLEDLRPSMNNKKLKLNREIQPEIMMRIDPTDFVQLAKNVLDNALKYSRHGKSIKVSLSTNGKTVLTVKDQGIGIPQDELKRIGDRFFRASNAADKPGTGLGVAIVNKILNSYGGTLEIDSQIDKGTTVKVII